MKKLILFFIILISYGSYAETHKSTALDELETETSSAREVWMFSYDEFLPLRKEQKKIFYKKLAELSQKSTLLKDMIELKSELNIKKNIQNEERWTAVEEKIEVLCSDKKNFEECEQIAKVRDDILLGYRGRK